MKPGLEKKDTCEKVLKTVVSRWWLIWWHKKITTSWEDSCYCKIRHDTTSKFYKEPIITGVEDATEINFGVLSPFRDAATQMTAANNLGVKYLRNGITLTEWKGTSKDINTFLANGFKIILNLNYCRTPCPFPKDLKDYEAKLRSVLNVYSPELVVIENEELNAPQDGVTGKLDHLGSLQDYINELEVAVRVCKEKNIQVTNAGLTNQIITSLYFYYANNNKQDSIDWLSKQNSGLSKDPLRAARCDSLLRAFKRLDLDFVNIHWYEPHRTSGKMTGILNVICDYIEQQTGKPVITNETGVRSYDPYFTTELMKQWVQAEAKYVIFYNSKGIGLGEDAHPLTTDDGGLLDNGKAFNDNIIQQVEY